jgi:hypothetical protein
MVFDTTKDSFSLFNGSVTGMVNSLESRCDIFTHVDRITKSNIVKKQLKYCIKSKTYKDIF